MKRVRPPVALTVLALIAACAPENDIVSTTAPAPSPVVDSAPYVCKLIPEQAFRLISGVTGPLAEKIDGNERNGDCRAPDTVSQHLEVWWMQEGPGMSREHLDFLIEDRRKVYADHGGVKLPPDLGDGMAAHLTDPPLTDQPFQVSAKFRCSSEERLIDLFLPEVAKGRDAIKDMTDLMRIAQKRYGEIYDCTPGT